MATTSTSRYNINGVVSADKTVLQNLDMLCGAAQSWLTYDLHQGRWAVIINKDGTSKASFNDDNILGSISVTGTGLKDLYNSVKVEFPHVDLADQLDHIQVEIPSSDRNAYEMDNTLNIQYDIINDPVMAEMLGSIELKQSRVDQVISFTTDFGYIGLRAGDLINVTNSVLGFTNKMFRITSIAESDGDDNSLKLVITALAYDANVYSTADLARYTRSNENGIVTIGAIGIPTQPTITNYTSNARPHISATTYVPTGIVEQMELWYSTNGTDYSLVEAKSPVGGGTFSTADQVVFDYDKLIVGNVYAKVRGMNSTTTGPYSNVGSLLNITPVQVTNAIQDGKTSLLSSAGSLLVTGLGAAALIGKLGDFFGNNANATMADKITSTTGGGGGSVVLGSFFILGDTIDTSGTVVSIPFTEPQTFTAPTAGYYKIEMDANFGGNPSDTIQLDDREITINVYSGNTPGVGNAVSSISTSAMEVDVFSDLRVVTLAQLDAGDYSIDAQYSVKSNCNTLLSTIFVTGPINSDFISVGGSGA